ncbi:acyl-CoA N-acyltransferase [Meira miltonrushii]|uniref:Acyl-CoA N-acyltransferase n=1 Tax=Meira miltonrushii TaxID=1280837 RepID=A0A316VAT3_9BASI|nr:acyl-CoA N-acyltransferase [Meira miltonrushii]PWN34612.1 acyl-CoA N-acyltransferase [Meira miltonrushii]
MSVTIRRVKKEDEEAWTNLWEQYNVFYKRTIPIEVTKKTFERLCDENVRMYGAVAVDNSSQQQIVGFVTWYPHANTSSIEEVVYLNDLFVDPTIRNKGAGRALIEHVADHAKTIPAHHVYWLTQHFNHRAQLLYTKVANKSDYVHYMKSL